MSHIDSGEKAITLHSMTVSMRTALSLMILLIFTSLGGMMNVNAAPPVDGVAVVIDADETWNVSEPMNGDVLVKSGSTLTIDAVMTVGVDNIITGFQPSSNPGQPGRAPPEIGRAHV